MPVRSTISAACDAIDQWRAEQPPITKSTATAEDLLRWLTDEAQRFARSKDAGDGEGARHSKGLIDKYRAELLRRLGE